MHRVVIVFVTAVLISWTYGCVETPTEAPKCFDIPWFESNDTIIDREWWMLELSMYNVLKDTTLKSYQFAFVAVTDSTKLIDLFHTSAAGFAVNGTYRFKEQLILDHALFYKTSGSRVAFFLILLFEDRDGDFAYSSGDSVLGCSSLLAITQGDSQCMKHQWCQFGGQGLHQLTADQGVYRAKDVTDPDYMIRIVVNDNEHSYEIPRPWISPGDTLIIRGSTVVRK